MSESSLIASAIDMLLDAQRNGTSPLTWSLEISDEGRNWVSRIGLGANRVILQNQDFDSLCEDVHRYVETQCDLLDAQRDCA